MPETIPLQHIQHIVEQMKHEILDDMRRGLVPSTCHDFTELQEYVDANMYADTAITELGYSERWLELANATQGIVDTWLKDGRPART